MEKLKCMTDEIYSLLSNEHPACRDGKISHTDDKKQLGQSSFKSKKGRDSFTAQLLFQES